MPNHPGPRRHTHEQELLAAYGQLSDATEVLNERALMVMRRMSDKLTGRDFIAVRSLFLPRHEFCSTLTPMASEGTEVLDTRALMVMRRMSDKLTGRDLIAVRIFVSMHMHCSQ